MMLIPGSEIFGIRGYLALGMAILIREWNGVCQAVRIEMEFEE
jgi:hypothetical protein